MVRDRMHMMEQDMEKLQFVLEQRIIQLAKRETYVGVL